MFFPFARVRDATTQIRYRFDHFNHASHSGSSGTVGTIRIVQTVVRDQEIVQDFATQDRLGDDPRHILIFTPPYQIPCG